MNLQTKKILGINVTVSPEKEILEEIRKYLQQSTINNQQSTIKKVKPFLIFTPNPEIITYAQKDEEFARIVNTAQINLPDGAGIVWATKKLYGIEIEKIAGIDFMENLVNLGVKQRLTIGLIGGRGDLADEVRECLLLKHPELKVEVFEAPEVEITNYKLQITNKFKIPNSKIESGKDTSDGGRQASARHDSSGVEESENRYFNSLAKEIIVRKIDILFVALGFPKQEYFIDLICQQLTINNYQLPIILMAVGGSFDYISGRIPRASKFMRDWGLEWLFRLIVEPKRIVRQLKGAKFFRAVLNS